jgi:predicted ATP-grasp superfamily ATP-dependent carboligase
VTGRVLIVEDGLGPHPLVAARSFGAAGWFVGIGSPARGGRAASSRYVSAWHPVPPAEDDEQAFVAATAAAVASEHYDLVFGADDVEVLALSAARAVLAARGAAFPYPEHEAVLRTIDKLAITRAAEQAGVGVPRTLDIPGGQAELPADLRFPVVVKARLHWTPGQRIEGGLGALTLLLDRSGRVRAQLQQEAERISPFWHNSVAARTVPVDADLAERVAAMLRNLGWWGLVNLQFLLPAGTWNGTGADTTPYLIDVNGRFYGSIALARAAGLDLPVLWAGVAQEASPGSAPTRTGQPGVRYQSLEEDLRRAVAERRGGLIADLRTTVGYASGAAHSTWSSDDRRPAVRRTGRLIRSESRELARRLLRG